MPALRSQILLDILTDLANLERRAFHFREGHGVDQVPGPNHRAQLAEIHLRNDHGFKTSQDFTKVFREGIQVPQMCAGNWLTFALHSLDRRSDRAVSRSPSQHQDLSSLFSEDFHGRNISR